MKRALVTGADGFIGSHLTEKLVKAGYDVTAFVYYNSLNSWGWLDTVPEMLLSEIKIISGDIRDYNFLLNSTKDQEIIFHLAALIGIPFSYRAPESYIETNVKGTLNVLQAAKTHGTERVLITSTSEVYGTAKYVPIDEEHPKQPQSPYAASKVAADALAESFYKSYDLPLTIVRPFNTFGPRQSARAIIPSVISQITAGHKEIKIGSAAPTRDLVYIEDTVNGFLEISKSDKLIGEHVNIATNSEITIGDLINKILQLCKSNAKIISEENRIRPENSEINRLLGSNKKLSSNTNWQKVNTIEQGLKKTIEWFSNKETLKYYKSDIYNI